MSWRSDFAESDFLRTRLNSLDRELERMQIVFEMTSGDAKSHVAEKIEHLRNEVYDTEEALAEEQCVLNEMYGI